VKLSAHLASWRAERPDEWTMDNFIRKAQQLEDAILTLVTAHPGYPMNMSDEDEQIIGSIMVELQYKATNTTESE